MDHSPFGRPPAEVRNGVSELVLIKDGPITVAIRMIRGIQSAQLHHTTAGSYEGLLRTCKAIHAEAHSIFYTSNTFELQGRCASALRVLKIFLQNTTVLPDLLLLRKLSVHLNDGNTLSVDRRSPFKS